MITSKEPVGVVAQFGDYTAANRHILTHYLVPSLVGRLDQVIRWTYPYKEVLR